MVTVNLLPWLLVLQLLEGVSSRLLEISIGTDERASPNPTWTAFDDHPYDGSVFRQMAVAKTKAAAAPSNLEDVRILLDVKAEFGNGEEVLTDWKSSLTSAAAACNWTAVTCGGPQGDRVIALSLGDLKLVGGVPPSLCKLPFLQHLNLSYNALTGRIPPFLGNCTSLVYVNLWGNLLEGEIPYFGDPSTTFRLLQTVNFGRNSLTGPIPEWFGGYSSLTRLGLQANKLTGGIPSSLAQLSNLQVLYLSYNDLSGPVNPLIANCSALVSLALDMNNFDGPVPSEIGALQNLENLYLGTNDFKGQVPVAILTNCTKLKILLFENNRLSGEIPPEVGGLQELVILYLRGNELRGRIPAAISNCSSLSWLSLDDNQLVGEVPWEFGRMKTLSSLNLWNNNLSNILPSSLANCSSLYRLTFGRKDGNLIDGQSITPQPFPPWMSSLVNMSYLQLMTVGVYGPLPSFFSNFTQLESLYLPYNNLTGPIPDALGNLTQLQELVLTSNSLTGRIPNSIGDLRDLEVLHLGNIRKLTSEIPSEVSFWSGLSLTRISIRGNKFSGSVRSAFGSQFLLELLDVSSNRLTGPIPAALGSMSQLKELVLSDNHLNGTVPAKLFTSCTELITLQFQNNNLTGTIPDQVGNLTHLQELDLSSNQFTGEFPSLGNMTSLTHLNLSWNQFSGALSLDLPRNSLISADLSHNQFSGPLPPQLSSLKALEYLDLSVNSFSGTIPAALGQLQGLSYFNVSFNDLDGPIPTTGVFASLNLTGAFLGNPELCGALVDRNCSSGNSSDIHGSGGCKGFECKGVLIGVVCGASVLVILLIGFTLLWRWCYKRRAAPSRVDAAIRLNFPKFETVLKLSAEDLKRATENFSPDYLIGAGAGTKVYKFVLPESDHMYAAKVLHSGPSSVQYEKLLLEEVHALSQLHHRNVLRVVGFCCNEEIKAAILEYMPNGSLHDHLHEEPPRGNLPWETRLNIAIGMAQGMVYLHNEFPDPIIHRDLKPMNVLLDTDLEPKICDLGLGKFANHREAGEASATALYGTIGYIPPEYTISTRVSTKGDVYAYGIMILELLTGRQPTERSFGESENIVTWAQARASVVDILDPALVPHEANDESPQTKQITLLLQVALLCCQPLPQSRPAMRDVLGMLLQIKETSSKVENNQNLPNGFSHSVGAS